jgi:riboflavin kinase/FMN adenylyltransferase
MGYQISGRVVQGNQYGQKIGFPTANIKLEDKIPSGVYESVVFINNKKYVGAVFVGEKQKALEVHIINFKGNLYGEEIVVSIEQKIRDVQKFKNEKCLINQIKKDVKIVNGK